MTRQTQAPLQRLPINASAMPLTSLVDYVESGKIDLNPPYQRGDVWTTDQRVALVYSWLCGATVPSITINDRSGNVWTDLDVFDIGQTDRGIWAVIDGRWKRSRPPLPPNGRRWPRSGRRWTARGIRCGCTGSGAG